MNILTKIVVEGYNKLQQGNWTKGAFCPVLRIKIGRNSKGGKNQTKPISKKDWL